MAVRLFAVRGLSEKHVGLVGGVTAYGSRGSVTWADTGWSSFSCGQWTLPLSRQLEYSPHWTLASGFWKEYCMRSVHGCASLLHYCMWFTSRATVNQWLGGSRRVSLLWSCIHLLSCPCVKCQTPYSHYSSLKTFPLERTAKYYVGAHSLWMNEKFTLINSMENMEWLLSVSHPWHAVEHSYSCDQKLLNNCSIWPNCGLMD